MASPIPKPAALRQRRNKTSTKASFQADPAAKVALPELRSAVKCVAPVDSVKGCILDATHHTLEWFAKAETMPHEFVGAVMEWHPLAAAWWDVVWASPMAAEEWIDADVPNLLVLVRLVDTFWRTNDPKLAAEIRQASKEFGISPMSRRSLQWEIKRLTDAEKPKAPSAPRSPARSQQSLSVLAGGKR